MKRKVVIAPNAFKNSLAADKVAEAVAKGFRNADSSWECVQFPVGDGGDGTGALLGYHRNAKKISVRVRDPLGDLIDSQFHLSEDGMAIIELADASGLRLLKEKALNVIKSNTFGTGELIKQALDHGANKVVLCVGGSATVDGGCGLLNALGFKFLSSSGDEIVELPERMHEVTSIDPSLADPRIFSCPMKILVDVRTIVSGEFGCARVFGTQKGATKPQIEILHQGLQTLCNAIYHYNASRIDSIIGGGAAGGVAATLHGILHAEIVSGIEYFLENTNFENILSGASLVITGEGRLDDQTLTGKAPMGVALAAKKKGIPVVALAGEVDIDKKLATQYFDMLLAIQTHITDRDVAFANTYSNLEATAKVIALKYTA